MAGIIEKIDTLLEDLFNGWNGFTTVIAIVLFLYAIYPLLFQQDPDTHPLMLSRQSNIAAIRQPNESAAYRSLEVPHGYPLKSGLNVKDPGASKWAGGKDGDIRDIWRSAINGVRSEDGSTGQRGKIVTLRGRDEIVEHDLNDLTKEIIAIGTSIRNLKGTKVAIYLPNSTEFLCSIFAAAFYGFTPILIPYETPTDVVINYLQKTNANFLIAAAGSLPLGNVKHNCPAIHGMKWVVPETSRDMDWAEDVDGVHVLTWHKVVEQHQDSKSLELPLNQDGEELADLVCIWQGEDGPMDVRFTQGNIVSASASLNSAIPIRKRLSSSDLFLPADSLTHPYVLCFTLAALFSNSSVALNSQAKPGIDLTLVTRNIHPTIIVTSPESALKLLKAAKATIIGPIKTLAMYQNRRSLANGVMPASGASPGLLSTSSSPSAKKIRLICISERADGQDPPISSSELNDLRAYTGAHVIYALTVAQVAGALCQTGLFDYRVDKRHSRSHFGAPLSSVEIKLLDKDTYVTTSAGDKVQGQLVANGPAVVGKQQLNLGILATIGEDGTLSYVQ